MRVACNGMRRAASRRRVTQNKLVVLAAVRISPGLATYEYAAILGIGGPWVQKILFEWAAKSEIVCRKRDQKTYLWYPVEKSG